MDLDRWRAVERVLDLALAEDPQRWPAVLDASCSGDPELRAEVESLLQHVPNAGRYPLSPPSAIAAAIVAETNGPEHDARDVGRRVGAYRLLQEIGRGGTARVFLAERADGQFEQQVAVKLLRPGLDTELDQARFRAERQILAALNHPNIARLFDGGVTDDGVPYLVLEYVDGKPIDKYCAERGLSFRQQLEVFLPVLDAVQYAHRNLVVHRDIKPSNILVTADGEVKLLDFGLAKLVGAAIEDAVPLTMPGQRWMTPEYAAPEQVTAGAITTSTDIYQLGAVLYELLAGTPPLGRRDRGMVELEHAILREEPRPPSLKDDAHRQLRGDVDAIVLSALRKEPERRYSSATAFRDDIQNFLKDEPVRARPDTLLYRARKLVRRNAVPAVGGVLAVSALIATTAVSIHEMRDARRERDRAQQALRRSRASTSFESLIFNLLPVGGTTFTYDELISRGRQVIEREFRGDAESRMELGIQFAQHYLEQGKDTAALALVAQAVVLADSVRDLQMQVRARCEMAYASVRAKRIDSALVWLSRAKTLRTKLDEPDRGTLDACEGAEGDALVRSNPDSSVRLYRAIAARFVAAGDTANADYANMVGDVARALHMAKRDRESVKELMHVSDLQQNGFAPNPTDNVVLMYNVSSAFGGLGEYKTAREWLASRVALVPSVDSAPEQAVFAAYTYGSTLYRVGEADSAEVWLNRALVHAELMGSRFGLQTEYMLARIALDRGRNREALGRIADADSIFLRIAKNPDAKASRAAFRLSMLTGALTAATAPSIIAGVLDSIDYKPTSMAQALVEPLLESASRLVSAHSYTAATAFAEHAVRIAAVDSTAYRQSAIIGRAELIEARVALGQGDVARARTLVSRAIPPLTYGLGAHEPLTTAALALRDSLER